MARNCVGLDIGSSSVKAVQIREGKRGMELVAYSGPENGQRDHKSFVLKSGSIRFVINGAVSPDSPLIAHHAKHGDDHRAEPRHIP